MSGFIKRITKEFNEIVKKVDALFRGTEAERKEKEDAALRREFEEILRREKRSDGIANNFNGQVKAHRKTRVSPGRKRDNKSGRDSCNRATSRDDGRRSDASYVDNSAAMMAACAAASAAASCSAAAACSASCSVSC